MSARPDRGSAAAAVVAGNLIAFAMALPFAVPLGSHTASGWGLIVYLGVFQIAVAYTFVTRGLKVIPALEASLILLIEPVLNRLQVEQSLKRLPLGLYSHSDQIEQWQTSVPHSRSGVGWAGRLMDAIKEVNSSQVVSMNISTDGSNVWQTGISGAEYAISAGNAQDQTGGAVALSGYAKDYAANQTFLNAASAAGARPDRSARGRAQPRSCNRDDGSPPGRCRYDPRRGRGP